MKKLFMLSIVAVTLWLLTSCGSTSSTASQNPNTVRVIGATFSTSSITITKGSTITFADDPNNGALHILVIGQNAQQESEQGSPDFGGLGGERLNIGDSWTSPPWNTAGAYHITCTIHPQMNLTVIVTS
jgi:plastocyanin